MRRRLVGILLFTSTLIVIGVTSGNSSKPPAQQASQQRMDKWDALDWSLKNAKPPYKSIHTKNGFVPDESTAAKIGEAVAIAQYGEKQISQERPFEARLRGDIWTIMGTLHPEGVPGGTAVVQLSKTDGRILLVIHQE